MKNKSIFGKRLEGTITSDDILGKNVYDIKGGLVGVAEKVFLDSKTLDFIGIAVDKGMIKKGLTIGKGYIDHIAKHAIFLKIFIALNLKGMTVFDKEGRIIGIVKSVLLHGTRNSINKIIVSPGLISKNIFIDDKHIHTVGENVVLNITKEKLLDYQKNKI